MALASDTKGLKGTNMFRTVFFMPNLIGGIVLGYIWQTLINWCAFHCWNSRFWQLNATNGLLGTDHSVVLAADWIYDDHLYCRTSECIGSGSD
ncbi:MAG: hypothetical protein ACLU4P_09685 [Ruminococcus sp.]